MWLARLMEGAGKLTADKSSSCFSSSHVLHTRITQIQVPQSICPPSCGSLRCYWLLNTDFRHDSTSPILLQAKRQGSYAAAEEYLTSIPVIVDTVRETLYSEVRSGKVWLWSRGYGHWLEHLSSFLLTPSLLLAVS